MRISDWSSDVCSSDLAFHHRYRCRVAWQPYVEPPRYPWLHRPSDRVCTPAVRCRQDGRRGSYRALGHEDGNGCAQTMKRPGALRYSFLGLDFDGLDALAAAKKIVALRSEENTSELKSLMRISNAVFCL